MFENGFLQMCIESDIIILHCRNVINDKYKVKSSLLVEIVAFVLSVYQREGRPGKEAIV